MNVLDALDFERVNTLLEGFNQSTGFVTAILDLEGNVLSKSGWRQICTEFHRVNPKSAKNCAISDTVLANQMSAGGQYHFYQCLNGLVDVAVPIVINGEHIANLFSGQFFFEEPDRSFFRKQASQYGFNEIIYLKALGEVPVVSKEKVQAAMGFLLNMTRMISEMTVQKLELLELNKELQRTEERYRTLFREMQNGFAHSEIICDPQGRPVNSRYLAVNPAFERMTGRKAEDVVGRTILEVFPALEPNWIETFGRVALTGEPAHFVSTAAELGICFEVSAFRPASNQYACTFSDITERKRAETEREQLLVRAEMSRRTLLSVVEDQRQAEAARREIEARYRTIFELAPDGIFIADPNSRYIEANASFCRALGYTRDELVGLTKADIVASADPPKMEPVQSTVSSLTEQHQNWLLRRKDGSLFPAEIIVTVMPDGNALGLIRDITERRRAERDLVQSERQYRTLFENMTAGFVLFEVVQDDHGIPVDLIILAANQGFEKATGLKAPEVVGKRLTRVLPGIEDDEADWIGTYGNVALAGGSRQFEQGSERLGFYYSVTAYQSGPNQCAVTFVDITARKRMEQERVAMEIQMRQQQRLESIGTLASGVAHEINNPINGAMNYAQLIQDRLPPDSPLIAYAGEILHETKRVATIVRNLLAFSRNEKQSHSRARMVDIIEGTLSLIRTVMRQDQITLTVSVPEDLPDLKCRTQQIQQVLMNLMTNARDALNERYPGYDPDKVLRLGASLLEKEGRRWIRVTVEDHGTGITPEVRERMFDPFFTTKPRDQGTGLGLSISHGIVKEHHGELTVESEPGRITCLHLDLPVDNGWET